MGATGAAAKIERVEQKNKTEQEVLRICSAFRANPIFSDVFRFGIVFFILSRWLAT
jgi:hypothetical protein